MDEWKTRHRGTPNPLEFPIGWWTAFALCALVASIFVLDETGWWFAMGVGLLGLSMAGFYLAVRLIRRGNPDSEGD